MLGGGGDKNNLSNCWCCSTRPDPQLVSTSIDVVLNRFVLGEAIKSFKNVGVFLLDPTHMLYLYTCIDVVPNSVEPTAESLPSLNVARLIPSFDCS